MVVGSYTVCMHVGGPKWGTLGPRPLGWGPADSQKQVIPILNIVAVGQPFGRT